MIGVLVKYPQPGKVKTRLAKDVGDQPACDPYEKMIRKVHSQLPTSVQPIFFCDPFRPLEDYRKYFSGWNVELRVQRGNDLGERMKNALSEILPAGVLVGTDCIDLSPKLLEEAAAKLREGFDLVLGPATDGGYYLIGVNQIRPEIFTGIEWSTEKVLAQTLQRAQGMKVHLLAEKSDIDTLQDLEARAREKGRRIDGNTVLADLIV